MSAALSVLKKKVITHFSFNESASPNIFGRNAFEADLEVHRKDIVTWVCYFKYHAISFFP